MVAVEQKPQQSLLFPQTSRSGRGGSYTPTEPFLPKKDKVSHQEPWIKDEHVDTFDTRPLKGITYWKRIYKEMVDKRKLDLETARKLYKDPHFEHAYSLVKSKVTYEPEILRQKLIDEHIAAWTCYDIGLTALRNPLPGKEEESKILGLKLFEKAFILSPSPLYPSAYIEEHKLKTEDARKKREKETEERKVYPILRKKDGAEEFNLLYYAERIDFWGKIYRELVDEKDSEFHGEFKKRHDEKVIIALRTKKLLKEGVKPQRYEPSDFQDILNNPRLNAEGAYFAGLVALRHTLKRYARKSEILGFILLVRAYELAENKRAKAFYAWVLKEEYLEKKSKVEPKGHAREKELSNIVGRSHSVRYQDLQELGDSGESGA